jgi:hypothetical protein
MAIITAAMLALWWIGRRVLEKPEAASEHQPLASRDRPSAFGEAEGAAERAPASPALRRNQLGQPLGTDGQPLSTESKLREEQARPLAAGDIPLTPPRYDDAAQRERFKRWWVGEVARRTAVYQRLVPRDDYPPEAETLRLVGQLYDAAEPRGPDESVKSAYARRKQWRSLWRAFLDQYGATLKTVVSRGGDPQYGTMLTPPQKLQPSPTDEVSQGEPASPADKAPPGRGPDEPGGSEPLPGSLHPREPR